MAADIRNVITQYILDEIAFGELDEHALTDDTHLFERGLLNSLNITQLIAFLEERYDFTLDPTKIEFENFVDIAHIAALVEASLPADA